MTGFKPGDRVRHHTGVEGTVTRCNGTFATVDWDHYVRANTHHVDLLTPLGEPMSKTFKSSSQASGNRTLSVDRLYGDPRLLISGENRIGFMIDPSDAPALSLAILEAAGVQLCRDPKAMAPTLSSIACDLEELVVQLEMDAKEAADRAKLESEAVQLLCKVKGWEVAPFASFGSALQTEALELACFARELHGVTA